MTKFVNGTRAYSTFLGGNGFDSADGIAVDSSGNAYVAGSTSSTDFPIVNGYDASFNSVVDGNDVFVTRLSSSGSTINYSTYFGGTGNNNANDIALNGSKAYVTGSTGSSNLPTKNAYDSSYNGGTVDAFVAGFDTTQSGGSSLLTSSFLGGSNSELGYSIAYESGSLYVSGATLSTNFPMKNAYDSSHNGNYDIFVTKLSATTSGSSALQYSTYLGASGDDQATAIAVKSGNAYITGFTDSSGFPIKYSARITDSNNNIIYSGASYKGSTDALVAAFKTTSSGTGSRLYSTYLGGSGADQGRGIGVESDGRVTIVGYTSSTNFPAIDHWPMTSSNSGSLDVFLTKLNPPLTSSGNMSFLNSGYLGGSNADYAYDVAVDADGRAYIAGSTYSTNFPTVNPQQGTYSGGEDVFVTKIFPEYTGLRCRWAHTPGVLTTVYYKWGLGLEASGPGTWRTEAFEPGIASWNNLNNKIRYQFDATGSVTMRLYTLNDGKGGETIVPCSGGYTASAEVKVNTFYNLSPNPAVTAHEQGHALSLGHISSATISLMGNNPNGAVSAPTAFDDELVDTIYP